MLINNYCRVTGNIARDLLFPLLVYKTSKPTDVDVLSASHRGLHYVKERFYGMRYIGFIDSGFLCYLCDYVCFGHVGISLNSKFSGRQI